MAKRFTDIGKWDDLWFTELSSEHKLFWIYILDKCDMAGVWKVNFRMAEFCLGFKIHPDSFLKAAIDRIEVHKDKWLIKKFINFQYGELTETNKCYRGIMSCLSSFEGNKGHLSPLKGGNTRQDNIKLIQDKNKPNHFEGCKCPKCKKAMVA